MIGSLREVIIDCALAVAAAVALVVVLRVGRAAIDALPMSRARRARIARLRPIVGATLVVVYVVLAARWILESDDRRAWIAFAVAAGVFAAASWGALRDAIEGAYLRAGHTLAIGDRVEIGAVRGRIQRLGLRSLVIEATDGELAVIPYRTVTASTLLRTPGDEHSAFYVFRVAVPEHRTIPDAKRVVREAALLCHWSSVARQPEVVATDDGHLEVTVFPIDADHVTDIERTLRRELARHDTA